jgi:hypothetical protein
MRTVAVVAVLALLLGTGTVAVGATATGLLDDDGLAPLTELRRGTGLLAADTDGDGLDDGAEIDRYGTDPLAADTDGDGLDDGPEVTRYGTDPLVADTDDDGLEDGPEVRATDVLPGADPLQPDVYVEVDYMAGNVPERAELDRIERHFAAAPVSVAGTSGVDLHFVYSDEVPRAPTTTMATEGGGDYDRLKRRYFDHGGDGYHYLLVVESAYDGDTRVAGVTRVRTGELMIPHFYRANYTGSTLMHELGHALGLTGVDSAGIDSERYSYDAYPSVMNYNAPNTAYGYSDGTHSEVDNDDWVDIWDGFYTPPTGRLD